MKRFLLSGLVAGFLFLLPMIYSDHSEARAEDSLAGRKILVVMSYHQGNFWQDQEKKGLAAGLRGAELVYFYLDSKRDKGGAAARAKEAFNLFRDLAPDVVVATDDNAQSMFVVPYLKNKVKTPVIFCGVNNDAGKYGYPATNVNGIVEVKHFRETINFVQLVTGNINRLAVIYKDNPSNQLNISQMAAEKGSYPIKDISFMKLETLPGAVGKIRARSEDFDAFLVLNLTGLLDKDGKQVESQDAVRVLSGISRRPIISTEDYNVKAGALCGVVKTGFEQGELAARMVREVLGGKEIGKLPVGANKNGQRQVNLTTAKKLGIRLGKEVVFGSTLIK
jgi:ABC-type uncharacterized transport system substrate-binding protein